MKLHKTNDNKWLAQSPDLILNAISFENCYDKKLKEICQILTNIRIISSFMSLPNPEWDKK